MSKANRATHIALLRGINVGGKNRVPMKELRAIFTEAGCESVKSHIQSGNVVFRATPSQMKKLSQSVARAMKADLGVEVPLVFRTHDALKKAARNNPFARGDFDPRLVMVGFLEKKPSSAAIKKLDPQRSPGDSFKVVGSEIHLDYPKGSARSKLTVDYIDRTLQTVCTARNWNTVQKLLALCGEVSGVGS
jgi:uncharacterized protein (DUF1697 family)